MKYVAAITVLILFVIPQASALTNQSVIAITSKAIDDRGTSAGVATVYSLYNRGLTSNSIGNGVLLCTSISGDGPIPFNSKFCWGSYRIASNGNIEVQGLARRPLDTVLAIVGGTGMYSNARGTLHIIRYASNPVRERLVFRLTAG